MRPHVTGQDITAVASDYTPRPAFDGEALFRAAEHDVDDPVIGFDSVRRERLANADHIVSNRPDLARIGAAVRVVTTLATLLANGSRRTRKA